jgi:hypothetical protein
MALIVLALVVWLALFWLVSNGYSVNGTTCLRCASARDISPSAGCGINRS